MLPICTGNTCRSTLAEILLRKMLTERSIHGVEVASVARSFMRQPENNQKN